MKILTFTLTIIFTGISPIWAHNTTQECNDYALLAKLEKKVEELEYASKQNISTTTHYSKTTWKGTGAYFISSYNIGLICANICVIFSLLVACDIYAIQKDLMRNAPEQHI